MNTTLELEIALWAIRNNISHLALNDLLKNLKKFPQLNHLPKDARTLLKTPPTAIVKDIKCGVYHHFAIYREIEHLIKHYETIPNTLFLMVGIDGLPLTKNPPSELWPILGYFSNIESQKPHIFIIGSYFGKMKPENSNEFLQDFVNELSSLIKDGFVFENKLIKVLLKGLICDTPAKSYILNVKGHTGKNSCLRCHTVGIYDKNYHRVYFPELYSPIRTHDAFISYEDSEFHRGETSLTMIPKFNIINDIPFDYMHCVCIGVMKKLLMFWNGNFKFHSQALPNNLLSVLNKRINDLSQFITEDFQRNLNENSRKHAFRDANRWKAVELRQVLLYTGMIVFNGILSKQVYEHFMLLCVAMRILSTAHISDEYVDFAGSLIHHFVALFPSIYGKMYMSHNVHVILHLADDVKHFGPLDNFSAFKFENYMQPLKAKVRSGAKPLQQIVQRYAEERILSCSAIPKSINLGPINVQTKSKNKPMTDDASDPQYTGWRSKQFAMKLNSCDNCVKMINGDIVVVENIATSKLENDILIIGRKYDKLTTYFDSPCSSKLLHIYAASQLSHIQSWKLSDVKGKLMSLPIPDSTTKIIVPLLHLQ